MNEQALNSMDIGKLDDIPIQGSRRIAHDGASIAVFRTASDEVFAIENRCPHAGGPLSEGIVHGNCVTCPLHNWVISLQDGTAQGADEGRVKRYRVKQEGERLLMASAPMNGTARKQAEPECA